jgi:hypothetical protein
MFARVLIEFVLIGLGAMAAGGFVAYRVGKARGRKQLAPPATRTIERGLKDVRVDDVLQYSGRDWLVEGVIEYEEDGHRWRAARMSDSPDERWCMVGLERQGEMTVRVLALAGDMELSAYPPDVIQREGVSFKMTQRGTATAHLNGNLGVLKAPMGAGKVGRCRWWRYEAVGDKTLIIEQWGDVYRALVGTFVPRDDVDLLSGS